MNSRAVVNDVTTAVAILGLTPLIAVGAEVIFDLSFLPRVAYRPGVALAGITLAFAALAAKAILLRPYLFDDPFDRYIARAIR